MYVLHVELGLIRRVNSDDLVPQQIVAGLQRSWNRRSPTAVVRDHLTHSPSSGRQVAADQSSLVDLEPCIACWRSG